MGGIPLLPGEREHLAATGGEEGGRGGKKGDGATALRSQGQESGWLGRAGGG